jgi:hypothetical protein
MEYTGWLKSLFSKRVSGSAVGPLSLRGYGTLGRDSFDTGTALGQWDAYVRNSALRAIIDRRAEVFINGKWYNTIGDKESTTAESKLFYEILNTPNGLQSSLEFKQDVFKALDIYGECYILKITLPGFTKVQGMIVLPLHLLEVVVNRSTYPFQISTGNGIESIKLTFTDGRYSYSQDLTAYKDSIIHITISSTPGTNPSRLVSLQDQINKLYIANNASNNILRHHGALMLITDDSKDGGALPMVPEDKAELRREYMETYGIGSDQSLLWFANKALKVQPISMPIKDLMLNETTRDATRQLCDTLGYPIDLLGFEEGAKLGATGGKENEAKKMLYQDMIIPQANLISSSMSKVWFASKEQVNIDYSHIECLQQSQVDVANKNKTLVDTYAVAIGAGIMTVDEAKKEMEFNGILTQNAKP